MSAKKRRVVVRHTQKCESNLHFCQVSVAGIVTLDCELEVLAWPWWYCSHVELLHCALHDGFSLWVDDRYRQEVVQFTRTLSHAVPHCNC
jgi:hypothetical protein